jgi:hypothetical protein
LISLNGERLDYHHCRRWPLRWSLTPRSAPPPRSAAGRYSLLRSASIPFVTVGLRLRPPPLHACATALTRAASAAWPTRWTTPPRCSASPMTHRPRQTPQTQSIWFLTRPLVELQIWPNRLHSPRNSLVLYCYHCVAHVIMGQSQVDSQTS